MGWELLKRWDKPIRFLLILSFLSLSTLAASMRVSGQAGYPWPGFIHYRLPELAGLFLGFMWVVGLVTASVVERPRRWDNAFFLLFFGLAASTMFRALTPDGGLPRIGVLVLVGLFVTNTFMCDSRYRLLRQSIFLFFLLIMFKFVFVPWVGTTGGLLTNITKSAVALLTLGGSTRAPSGAEHVLLFTAMVLFAAAVALQWPARSVWSIRPFPGRPSGTVSPSTRAGCPW